MIFLSYAIEDERIAERVYKDLINHGYDVWFGKVSLLAGQKWKDEIKKAIKNSKLFLALISSKSVSTLRCCVLEDGPSSHVLNS